MRKEGWESRLEAVIRAAKDKRFAWGVHDCGTFAADCILALTGIDVAADLRGKYGNEFEARALLGISLEESAAIGFGRLAAAHGFEPLKAAYAWRGDPVVFSRLFDDRPVEGLGVIALDGFVVSPGPAGLCRYLRGTVTHAWGVR